MPIRWMLRCTLAGPSNAGFGVPDGTVDANDCFFSLALFAQGC